MGEDFSLRTFLAFHSLYRAETYLRQTNSKIVWEREQKPEFALFIDLAIRRRSIQFQSQFTHYFRQTSGTNQIHLPQAEPIIA